MAFKIERYFKTKAAGAAKDNSDVVIPSGKTIIIQAVDFTAPAQQSSGVKIFAGPAGNPEAVTIAAAQGDKFISIPQGHGEVVGPLTFRIQLDNSANASGAFLGVAVYYEEL